LAGQEILA